MTLPGFLVHELLREDTVGCRPSESLGFAVLVKHN